VGTTAFGGGGFTVWGCFFLNCKIDLYVIDATLRGQKYRDQILRSLVVPHFDGHPLASRPILMDGNARPLNPYSARLSTIELLPWSAMSPNMNPIKHLWDYLGQKVNARTPKCQNIQELGTALVQGWQQYPQHRLRRLIHGMRDVFRNCTGCEAVILVIDFIMSNNVEN
jgi:hypothetical protein